MKQIEQKSFHVRRGDDVIVIAGGAKGRRAKITRVIRKKSAVILEGLDERSKGVDEGTLKLKEQNVSPNDLEKHRLIKPLLHYYKKSQQHPNGAMVWLEGPIHISNVMKVSKFEDRKSRRTQLKTD